MLLLSLYVYANYHNIESNDKHDYNDANSHNSNCYVRIIIVIIFTMAAIAMVLIVIKSKPWLIRDADSLADNFGEDRLAFNGWPWVWRPSPASTSSFQTTTCASLGPTSPPRSGASTAPSVSGAGRAGVQGITRAAAQALVCLSCKSVLFLVQCSQNYR